jgi:hypothetical protein
MANEVYPAKVERYVLLSRTSDPSFKLVNDVS